MFTAVCKDVVATQRQLALEAAVSDIENVVPSVTLGGKYSGAYFDLSQIAQPECADVERAVGYLEAVGRLVRHPKKAKYVQVLDLAAV